ncbi:MAG: DUF2786 domain-containing protein [Neptuniibacter sp.]
MPKLNKKIIDRIQKLLALSGSDNEHEAAIALKRAQALMQEYQVSDLDLELGDIIRGDTHACDARKPAYWVIYLTSTIGEAFACAPVLVEKPKGCDVAFIGVDPQPKIAAYAYEVLYRQLKTARTQHIKEQNKRIKSSTKTRRGDLFAQNWVLAVYKKIQKLAQTERTAALIAIYQEQEFNKLTDSKGREHKANRRDYASGLAGRVAGRKAQLHHGMQGDERQRLECM